MINRKHNNILISIGHPAQVHQFKNLYHKLVLQDYNVFILCKEKEISYYLLSKYKIKYIKIDERKHRNILSKILQIPLSCFKQIHQMKKIKPDIVISRGSIPTVWASSILQLPHLYLTDTESSGLADKVILPFVSYKLTALSYKKKLGKNHYYYHGNIELFYLHSNYFKPNSNIYSLLGIDKKERYCIVRFVSWDAHHDIGLDGITLENKIYLVREIAKICKVFITSEKILPEELKEFQIKIPPERIHDAIYFSDLMFGESSTMASEAAVMGTPSIYIDENGRGYTDEEGDFGLVYNFKPSQQLLAISKALQILRNNNKSKYLERNQEFLKGMIDPTDMIFRVIENYPESIHKLEKEGILRRK